MEFFMRVYASIFRTSLPSVFVRWIFEKIKRLKIRIFKRKKMLVKMQFTFLTHTQFYCSQGIYAIH